MSVPSSQVRPQTDTSDVASIDVIVGMVKQAHIKYVQLGSPVYMDDENDAKGHYLRWQLATIRRCAEIGYIGNRSRSHEEMSRSWLRMTAANHCFIWPLACDQDIYNSFISIMEVVRAREQPVTELLALP
ncbi:hypothetical protein MMC29_000190 [Sticta canariensis]|nr:hypothetical protein [Sticta canariensis]